MKQLKFLKQRWQRRLFRIMLGLIIFLLLYQLFLLPGLIRWGTTRAEFKRTLPGDELVLHKGYKNTMAVTVQAPPSQIWPWVAQMGLQKGGFYSYTGLENLFGCQLHNADRIHPEWQHPQVGYYEGVCQSAVNKNMPGWIVSVVVPNKAFVWQGVSGDWMMGVYIDSVNATTSRLITRMLYQSPETYSAAWWLDKVWFEWAHCVMQWGMITGIRKRAEGTKSK
ncbi:MAG: hypothetical protein ICV51_19930 [Flavisolibacter sp.]|nr:hypothetical protein [Flavisolibacter sp.]